MTTCEIADPASRTGAEKLSAYLKRESLSYSEFARRAGTPHARTIERIAKGQREPGRKMLQGIFAASNGELTANDWLIPLVSYAVPDGQAL